MIPKKDLEKTLGELKQRIKDASFTNDLVEKTKEKALAGIAPIEEVAALLRYKEQLAPKIIKAAKGVNEELFQKVIEFYAVSYISDHCVNACTYCGLSVNNPRKREKLSIEEIEKDFAEALKFGATDLCILAGEDIRNANPDFLARAANIAFWLSKSLERVTFNVAPMTTRQFQRVREQVRGPLQFRIFQESYDKEEYQKHHPRGPKSNYKFRLYAQERALQAGFDFVGIGSLLGLNSDNSEYLHFGHDFEILAMVAHAYHLKEISGSFPCSMSIPRLQAAEGCKGLVSNDVDDERYVFYNAILKLAMPESRLIVTRRESKDMMDKLRPMINIEDLATRPGVGGNYRASANFQNKLNDCRSSEEIIAGVREKGYFPKIVF
ncbi:hypothetical protein CL619_00105 [archaeon]|nr:hypothetical protein [archaeon]|tara:strand:- start:5316 stop:6455 length:1140 start_codon:yes stop_codon:yes gene_type:complete